MASIPGIDGNSRASAPAAIPPPAQTASPATPGAAPETPPFTFTLLACQRRGTPPHLDKSNLLILLGNGANLARTRLGLPVTSTKPLAVNVCEIDYNKRPEPDSNRSHYHTDQAKVCLDRDDVDFAKTENDTVVHEMAHALTPKLCAVDGYVDYFAEGIAMYADGRETVETIRDSLDNIDPAVMSRIKLNSFFRTDRYRKNTDVDNTKEWLCYRVGYLAVLEIIQETGNGDAERGKQILFQVIRGIESLRSPTQAKIDQVFKTVTGKDARQWLAQAKQRLITLKTEREEFKRQEALKQEQLVLQGKQQAQQYFGEAIAFFAAIRREDPVHLMRDAETHLTSSDWPRERAYLWRWSGQGFDQDIFKQTAPILRVCQYKAFWAHILKALPSYTDFIAHLESLSTKEFRNADEARDGIIAALGKTSGKSVLDLTKEIEKNIARESNRLYFRDAHAFFSKLKEEKAEALVVSAHAARLDVQATQTAEQNEHDKYFSSYDLKNKSLNVFRQQAPEDRHLWHKGVWYYVLKEMKYPDGFIQALDILAEKDFASIVEADKAFADLIEQFFPYYSLDFILERMAADAERLKKADEAKLTSLVANDTPVEPLTLKPSPKDRPLFTRMRLSQSLGIPALGGASAMLFTPSYVDPDDDYVYLEHLEDLQPYTFRPDFTQHTALALSLATAVPITVELGWQSTPFKIQHTRTDESYNARRSGLMLAVGIETPLAYEGLIRFGKDKFGLASRIALSAYAQSVSFDAHSNHPNRMTSSDIDVMLGDWQAGLRLDLRVFDVSLGRFTLGLVEYFDLNLKPVYPIDKLYAYHDLEVSDRGKFGKFGVGSGCGVGLDLEYRFPLRP